MSNGEWSQMSRGSGIFCHVVGSLRCDNAVARGVLGPPTQERKEMHEGGGSLAGLPWYVRSIHMLVTLSSKASPSSLPVLSVSVYGRTLVGRVCYFYPCTTS